MNFTSASDKSSAMCCLPGGMLAQSEGLLEVNPITKHARFRLVQDQQLPARAHRQSWSRAGTLAKLGREIHLKLWRPVHSPDVEHAPVGIHGENVIRRNGKLAA